MRTYIVKLYFKNTIHIGASTAGIDIEKTQDFIHSDTLWAGLCNNWAIMRRVGEISFDDMLNSFVVGHPLFQLSSAFPFNDENQGTRYFLPKPLSTPFAFSKANDKTRRKTEIESHFKDVKSIQIIEKREFIAWVNFQEPSVRNIPERQPTNLNGTLRPHNTLDRRTMASQLYHSGITYFEGKKNGLYFFLRANKEIIESIKLVLNVIEETGGIGGNRSIGVGQIAGIRVIDIEDNGDWNFLRSLPDAQIDEKIAMGQMLLSLYHPSEHELNNQSFKSAIAYNLISRKGWTGSLSVGHQLKRKTVSMLSEGSILTEDVQGSLANLTPETNNQQAFPHEVFRYGYAFTIPIRYHKED